MNKGNIVSIYFALGTTGLALASVSACGSSASQTHDAHTTDAKNDAPQSCTIADTCPHGPNAEPLCANGTCSEQCDVGFVASASGCVEHHRRIAAAWSNACAINASNALACWGEPGFSPPPSGEFIEVAGGASDFCAIRTNNDVVCWSSSATEQSLVSPAGKFVHIAVPINGLAACGILTSGELSCWTWPNRSLAESKLDGLPPGPFRALGMGKYGVAVKPDGTVARFGNFPVDDALPTQRLSKLFCHETHRAGTRTTCVGVTNVQQLEFFGGLSGTLTATKNVVDAVLNTFDANGASQVCLTHTDDTIACLPLANSGTPDPTVPAGEYRELAAGRGFGCAIARTGAIRCWGDNALGQATPPPGAV